MRFLNSLDEHVETTLCLGLSCMPLFFRICRPTSVGTENPEIEVDLSPRDDDGLYSTAFSNKKSCDNIDIHRRSKISMCNNKSYKIG